MHIHTLLMQIENRPVPTEKHSSQQDKGVVHRKGKEKKHEWVYRQFPSVIHNKMMTQMYIN